MRCAIVIPIFKIYPTKDEKNSFIQCLKIFQAHPVTLVCPENFNGSNYLLLSKKLGFVTGIERFKDNYFSDISGYNTLMLTAEFYKRFKEFEYILLYQLDAWVFRDELTQWCNKGFDYIGAPWFEGWHNALNDSPIIGVGNGGLSLRNIRKTIRLLNRMKFYSKVNDYLLKNGRLKKVIMRYNLSKRMINYLDNRRLRGVNEDYQIFQLSEVYKWYKIAPQNEAIKFSFDVNPSVLYKMNDSKLPFGCHGWNRYETEFWKQFINLKN